MLINMEAPVLSCKGANEPLYTIGCPCLSSTTAIGLYYLPVEGQSGDDECSWYAVWYRIDGDNELPKYGSSALVVGQVCMRLY